MEDKPDTSADYPLRLVDDPLIILDSNSIGGEVQQQDTIPPGPSDMPYPP